LTTPVLSQITAPKEVSKIGVATRIHIKRKSTINE